MARTNGQVHESEKSTVERKKERNYKTFKATEYSKRSKKTQHN